MFVKLYCLHNVIETDAFSIINFKVNMNLIIKENTKI